MSIEDIMRAWKDRKFRKSLREEERKLPLANPSGEVLSEEELAKIAGGEYYIGDDGHHHHLHKGLN